MNPPRPLRDVLGEQADRLAEDRQATLDEAGHPDLPDALVAEAVVSYADTAPYQVAEHLAPFVTAHGAVRLQESPGGEADLSHGLHLLATAPETGPADAEQSAEHSTGNLDADLFDGGLAADLDAGPDAGGLSSEAHGTAVDSHGGADSAATDFGSGAQGELSAFVEPAGTPEPAGGGASDLPIDEPGTARFPGDVETPFVQPVTDLPIAGGAGPDGDAGGGDEIDGF
jgi:hypothetical protein